MSALHRLARDQKVQDLLDLGYQIHHLHVPIDRWCVMRVERQGTAEIMHYIGCRPDWRKAAMLASVHSLDPERIGVQEAWRVGNELRRNAGNGH